MQRRPLVLGQRGALLFGVALVSAAMSGLGLVHDRLHQAVFGPAFSVLVSTLPLFGAALGAALVALFPRFAEPPRLFSRLGVVSGLGASIAVFSIIRTMRATTPEALDPRAWLSIGAHYLVASLPFAACGFAIASALRFARGRAAPTFFAHFVGLALGGAVTLLLMRAGVPRAGLFVALLFASSSIVFALGSREEIGPFSENEERTGGWAAAAFFLGTVALVAGDYGEQWLVVSQIRTSNLDKASFVEWDELGLVTVDRPARARAVVRVDGAATSTFIPEAKSRAPRAITDLAFALDEVRGVGPALVLAAGGGRDVRVAVEAGRSDVVAVELRRSIVRGAALGKLRDFGGSVFELPGVTPVVTDPRGFMRGAPRRFNTVIVSATADEAAVKTGALATTVEDLYTVEAVREMLAVLVDSGALVLTARDGEENRLFSLASAALTREGARDPRSQIFAASTEGEVAVVLFRTPLGVDEIRELHLFCKGKRYDELLAPDGQAAAHYAALVADPWALSTQQGRSLVDDTPPTDDRPFFHARLSGTSLRAALKDARKLANTERGLFVGLVALFGLVVAAAAIVSAPVAFRRRTLRQRGFVWAPRGRRARLVGFFGFSGAGAALLEAGLVPQLTTSLGHPIFAVTVVLTTLLLSLAGGALMVQRLPQSRAARSAARRAQVVAIVLALSAFSLPVVLAGLARSPLPLRAAVAILVISAVGVPAGALLSLGCSLAISRTGRLTAWMFAAASACGAVALVVGALAALFAGYSYVLLLGAVAYFVASAIVPPSLAAPRS
ncbi:MAG: hypothetical protein U0271_42735 [Polyangiaceae bacterium]